MEHAGGGAPALVEEEGPRKTVLVRERGNETKGGWACETEHVHDTGGSRIHPGKMRHECTGKGNAVGAEEGSSPEAARREKPDFLKADGRDRCALFAPDCGAFCGEMMGEMTGEIGASMRGLRQFLRQAIWCDAILASSFRLAACESFLPIFGDFAGTFAEDAFDLDNLACSRA